MKEKKQSGVFRIFNSISFRIMSIVVVLLVIATVILLINNQRMAEKNVEDYYSLSGRIVSEITALTAEKYGKNINAFIESESAEILQRVCGDYEIAELYIEVKSPDQKHEHDVLEITENEIRQYKSEGPGSATQHLLTDSEKKIFNGEMVSDFEQYVEDGQAYITFMHGLYDKNGNCFAICGVNFLNSDVMKDVEKDSNKAVVFIVSIFAGLLLILLLFLHRQILSPINKISRRMREYVNGEKISEEKLEIRGVREFSQMAEDFNTMNDEIHEYIRTMETVNAAANIQAGMLPSPEYETEEVKIDACMKPAKNVGGDLYDFIPMPDGRICFVIADVSGKGISAALFMAQVITAVRYNARQYETPADILKELNDDITRYNTTQMFVTVFVAVYDPEEGTLTCANAGHNPPYLIRDRLIPLGQEPDLLIGLFEEEEYHNETVKVEPEDILFLYTDGVNEAVSKNGDFLGVPKMEEMLMKAKENPAESGSFTKSILGGVETFSEGAEQHDDITMMAVRFKKKKTKNTLTVKADLKEAGTVREYILKNFLIPDPERKKIYLAVEEIFVNVCNYAYNDREPGTVTIEVSGDQNNLELRFIDSGIPYDPTAEVQQVEDYDPDTMMGGLGKLLAFSVMDQTEYKYENKQNILTLRKKL